MTSRAAGGPVNGNAPIRITRLKARKRVAAEVAATANSPSTNSAWRRRPRRAHREIQARLLVSKAETPFSVSDAISLISPKPSPLAKWSRW